jgi:AraC family transcriptional regulator
MFHKGNYMDIGRIYGKIFGWAAQKGYLNEKTRVIGIAYDDPNVVAEKDLRSEACLMIGEEFKEEGDVKRINISGGTYAVMEFIGPYAELHGAYAWFYGTWLKNNAVELADYYGFEEYMNDARNTPPTELITHIHMPLKE